MALKFVNINSIGKLIDLNKSWDESEHPRNPIGEFARKGEGSNVGTREADTGSTGKGAPGGAKEGREDGRGDRGTSSSISINGMAAEVVKTSAPRVNPELKAIHQLNESKSNHVFHSSIASAKKGNDHGAFVTLYDKDDYNHMKLFLSDDGSAGIAVKPDGDIVSVFKNVNISKAKASSDLLVTALENGGKKLDCYDGFLTKLYMKFGFIPVARVKFNREYAPDAWNYERDGEPDVIAFAHNGDSVDDILNGKWKDYKTYNPDDVPLLDDYDAVMAARDAYLGGDIKKGIGSDMLQKYPGGRWSTMNGRHVYIDKGGKIAPETDPKKGASVSDKAAKITEQGMKDIKVGSLYKFGRRTMVVDKVGRSYVYGTDQKGEKVKVESAKFKAKAIAGGSPTKAPTKPAELKAPVKGTNIAEKSPAKPAPTAPAKPAPTAPAKPAPTAPEPTKPAPTAPEPTKPAPTAPEPTKPKSTLEPSGFSANPPAIAKQKGITFKRGWDGDEAYSIYQNWKKRSKKEKLYFEQMMAQLGDIPPEQRRAKGLTFDKIEVNGETAGLYVGIWHQNMGENGVMEAHYGEIAPHLRRGHGIGSLMIANAIKESYERGGNGHIFLKSHTDAIPFYKKLGMNFIGGPQNIFDATPDLAGELYKRITGEELGGATKKPSRSKKTVAPDNTPLAKSIDTDTDDDTPVRPQKSTIDPSLKTFDDFVKLEDSLSTGFMLGDFNERMKSEFKTPYDDPDDSNDSDDDPDYSDVSDDDQE